jgi:hypothetical protein
VKQTEKSAALPALRTIEGTPAPLENVNATATRISPSQISSDGSSLERSDMMNLINASANHLFDTMKAQPNNDVDAVKNICVCAKQIKELLRLKLDVIKIKKETRYND